MDTVNPPPPADQLRSQSPPWFRSFLFALFLYVALRAWVLATAFDAVVVPVYEIPTIGSFSWALYEGVTLLPWNDHYDNAGAQLLTAWLGSLSFQLFGASYLALKLVPLAFGVLLLAMVGRMLARQFGGRAALIGMVSVAIAPPIVTKYSMLAKGNHFEGLTLLFITLLATLETPEPGRPRRRLMVAFTGLSLGFAFSMYFGSMLAGAVAVVAWWIRFGIRQSLADIPAALGGLAVGLIPFVVINIGTYGRAKNYGAILGSPTSKGLDLDKLLKKGQTLVTESVPTGACFEGFGGLSANVAETLFLVLTLISWCICAGMMLGNLRTAKPEPSDRPLGDRRRQRAALWILLAYPVGVLTVLTLKNLPIMLKSAPVEVLGVRYLLGYFFFSSIVIAVAIARLMATRHRAPRVIGWMLMLGLAATWPFTAAIGQPVSSQYSDGLAYSPVHLRQYAILFHRDLRLKENVGVDTSRMKACLENLSDAGFDDQRSELAMGLGHFLMMASFSFPSKGAGPGGSASSVTLDFEERDHPDLLRGAGMFIQGTVRGGPLQKAQLALKNGTSSQLTEQVDAILSDPDSAPWVAEGFGMFQPYPLLRRFSVEMYRSRGLLSLVPAELRGATLRGIGRSMADMQRLGLGGTAEVIDAELKNFAPADREVIQQQK